MEYGTERPDAGQDAAQTGRTHAGERPAAGRDAGRLPAKRAASAGVCECQTAGRDAAQADTKQALLDELERRRGEYLSGAALAQRLAVSRSAVWKAAASLRAAGYDIDARRSRGYALCSECRMLSAPGVQRRLSAPGVRVRVYGEVDSTNALARQAAEAGEAEGLVLIAASQTAGRGRRGRSFFSPPGGGLYMSALLRPRLPAQDAALMTTLAAVAVAEAVEAACGRAAGIKWVNDVYLDGKKVAGILTEAALGCEAGVLDYAVVGVGVNLAPPPGGFPPALAGIAGALFAAPPPGDAMARFAADVWDRFFAGYRRLPDTGFLDGYRRRSFLLGQQIEVLGPSGARPARALAIDERAGLVVEYPSGARETLSSGEVSVRRRP